MKDAHVKTSHVEDIRKGRASHSIGCTVAEEESSWRNHTKPVSATEQAPWQQDNPIVERIVE